MSFENLTIKDIRKGLLKKDFSAQELVKYFFKRIEREDKKISAFITKTERLAISQAEHIEKIIEKGDEVPPLAGALLAVKDNILIKDVRCTAASKILEEYIAPYDATVISRLRKAGSIFLGKTNLDEFAMGSSCENSAFFPTKNPHDPKRVAGGSSGGSAAAVAAGLSVAALGSDTAGSIRLPASFCGVIGFKPSYGTVSRYGLIAMASSLDQIGPLARNVADVKDIFEVIAGKDPMDSTSVDLELEKNKKFDIKEVRIGLPKEYFESGLDNRVERLIQESVRKFEKAGAKIKEVSLPYATDISLADYYIIMPAEVSANLARYDGIKYGSSFMKKSKDIFDVYFRTRKEFFGEEVKRRIMLGTFTLSAGYYDAYYLRAQKVRKVIKNDFDRIFQEVDILLTPTSPTTAFKLGEKTKDPLSMYLSDIYMTAVNLAGLPAVSVPCGDINGLPVGIQLIGNFLEDLKVLDIAQFFEKIK